MSATIESAARPVEAEGPEDRVGMNNVKRQPKKKTFAAKAWREAMMLVRRVHLYSGIFMFPFVLLYGFSGWFFNHPRYFSEGSVTAFDADDFDSPAVARMPSAEAVAEAVVDELNLESFLIDGPDVKLTDDKRPRFTGFLSYTVNAEDATYSITLNPNDASGEIRSVPVAPETENQEVEPPNPLAQFRSAQIAENPLEIGQAAVPPLLSALGRSSGEAFPGRRPPSVVFSAEADGVPCVVTYNLGNGSVTSIREDTRPAMGLKDTMRRMHLARIYTPQFDVRWLWALVVDAMFVSMVFWGISGLFMWWQVKRTRVLGFGVLTASIVFTAMMYAGMHDNLTEGGGRRGGGRGHGGGRSASVVPTPSPEAVVVDRLKSPRIDSSL